MATLFRRDGYPKDTHRLGDFYEARAKCPCHPEPSVSSQGGRLASRHVEHSIVYDYPILGYLEPEEHRASKVGHATASLLNQEGKSFNPGPLSLV